MMYCTSIDHFKCDKFFRDIRAIGGTLAENQDYAKKTRDDEYYGNISKDLMFFIYNYSGGWKKLDDLISKYIAEYPDRSMEIRITTGNNVYETYFRWPDPPTPTLNAQGHYCLGKCL